MAKYYLVIKNGQVENGAMALGNEQPSKDIYGKNAVFVETNEQTYCYIQALDCLSFAKKDYSHEARVKFFQYAQYYRKEYAKLIHK